MERLMSIQALRAIAAMLILAAHIAHDRFISGAAGVDLFFVISGFVMVYSSERFAGGGSWEFFLRRLARIAPLYWAVTTVVLIGILIVQGTIYASDLNRRNIVASYLFIPIARPSGEMHPILGAGWTLNFEMFFYAVFALALILPMRKAVVAVTVFFLALMWLSKTVPMPKSIAYLATPFLWEFIYGMAIGFAYRESVKIPLTVSVVLVSIATGLFVWTVIEGPDAALRNGRHIVWGGAAAFAVAGVVLSRYSVSFEPATLLGNASYALYLTHDTALMFMRIVFPKMPAVVKFALCITVALLVYRYFERPVTRFLQARIHRPHASSSTVSAEKSLP